MLNHLAALLTLAMVSTPAMAGNTPDYWVYFNPWPTTTPDKISQVDKLVERVYMTVGNNGSTAGTHQYKVFLRVWKTSPPEIACETTFMMGPFVTQEVGMVKKVAAFEAVYHLGRGRKPLAATGGAVKPGRYLLMAYFLEQIPSGGTREDTYPANNQYPFQPPQEIPVPFEVRNGADEIRCVQISGTLRMPAGRIPGLSGGTTSTGGGSTPPPPDPTTPFGWLHPVTTQNTGEPVATAIGQAQDAIAGNTLKAIWTDNGVIVRSTGASCTQCHSGGTGGWTKPQLCDEHILNFVNSQGSQHGPLNEGPDKVLKNLFRDWKNRNCPD